MNTPEKIRKASKAAALALVMTALLTTASSAHDPADSTGANYVEDRSGIYLGLKFVGSSLHAEDEGDGDFFIKDGGGGLQLDIGYRFNRAFALEFCIGTSNHETSEQELDADIYSLWLLGYYRFCPNRAFRPFIKFGLGGHGLDVVYGDASARANGGGIAIGAGFKYFFNPHFSLGLDLTTNIIQYDEATIALGGHAYSFEIDEEGSLTTLGISFAYSF
jgi:opacity protein-like surface antigen